MHSLLLLLLQAVDSTLASLPTISIPGVPVEFAGAITMAVSILLGILSSKVYEALQRGIAFLDGLNPTLKMLVNPFIAALIAFLVRWGSVILPVDIHLWTVQNINVGLVTVIAFLSHAGTSITSLKAALAGSSKTAAPVAK